MLRAQRPPSIMSQDDPLALAMRPPETETEAERRIRLDREAEARRISDNIDEQLKQDKKKYDKSKQDVKLLLLGQAESGKSTLQKQFQLMYSPDSMEQERASWRVVIYFNVARSVKYTLEILEAYGDTFEDDDGSSGSDFSGSDSSRSQAAGPARLGNRSGTRRDPSVAGPSSSYTAAQSEEFARQIAVLRHRLSPLVNAESSLADRLSGGVRLSGSKGGLYVRRGWQSRTLGAKLRSKGRRSLNSSPPEIQNGTVTGGRPSISDLDSPVTDSDELASDVSLILDECKDDITKLYQHEIVQRMIKKRRLRMDEWAEYCLSQIARISETGYVPSTDDILHARIQTMGVAEHVFDVSLHGRNVTWHLYDVGGARGQRHTWVPYFDDANAIIFVAPISAFDQYLEEDPRTNRIDDSLQLFTQICSNRLLKNVHLVLFLNKTDVLKAKLAAGVQVKKYITSYGDRPNEFDPVVHYFRAHFQQVHRRNNEQNRVLYTHLTSVVDTKTTRNIISNVRDSIFRGYLKSAALV
ncbi:hypothetical protein EVG20_g3516 [Dentipellis fragilis]|uniref:Guanine nucleotide-binding protein alpha-4 subunit n=1 Tax=Dentipellis fragilis TaxID=205917 RepID=A0A4Y9Z201_9AGAM|nr:hypothetical protein EVG20_g3516 [Dentipellis fragilis]